LQLSLSYSVDDRDVGINLDKKDEKANIVFGVDSEVFRGVVKL
jgi:hypothetical protein